MNSERLWPNPMSAHGFRSTGKSTVRVGCRAKRTGTSDRGAIQVDPSKSPLARMLRRATKCGPRTCAGIQGLQSTCPLGSDRSPSGPESSDGSVVRFAAISSSSSHHVKNRWAMEKSHRVRRFVDRPSGEPSERERHVLQQTVALALAAVREEHSARSIAMFWSQVDQELVSFVRWTLLPTPSSTHRMTFPT